MRAQLVGLVAACVTVVVIALLAPLLLLLHQQAGARAEAAALARAQAIVRLVPALTEASLPTEPVDDLPTSVFLADGRTLGVPAARTPAVLAAVDGTSSSSDVPDGIEIVLPTGERSAVRVVALDSGLQSAIGRLSAGIVALAAGLVVVAVVVADRYARRFGTTVDRLAAAAGRVADGDTAARARTAEGPPELQRLAGAVNRVAIRVDHLLETQRRESADIAHRLRTPLAALELDIGALTPSAQTRKLEAGLSGLIDAINGVIGSTRRPAADTGSPCASLTEVVAHRLRFWSVLAEETGRPVQSDLPADPLLVGVARGEVEAAIDALIANIFAHTAAGVAFRVTAQPGRAGGATLVVEDTGPGFTAADPLRRGRSGGGSTGLGLDIVRRTAEAAGGRVRIGTSREGGARVELDLGPPERPADG